MKRDDRKKQKKRLKEQKQAVRRTQLEALRKRVSLYPRIILLPEGGSPECVALVQRIVAEFDYENPEHCSPTKRKVFQTFRQMGFREMMRRLESSMKEAAQHGYDRYVLEDVMLDPLTLHLGNWIFDRFPDPYRESPLPFAYFFVYPSERDLVIRFAFLPSVMSDHGTIYYPPLEPKVAFGGGNWKVGFFRHAIERACERLCPSDTISYAHFSTCTMYFRTCIYYEPCELPDGQHAIRLLHDSDGYTDGDDDPYITTVLGLNRRPGKSTLLYRALGYCPVAFVGPRAVAKTFLYPGYRNTPEDHLVRTAAISAEQRRDLLEIASDNRARNVFRGRGIEAIKWYHDNGIPQIFELDRKLYSYQ